jgi:peptidyl-prolyl cis-trans isomerase A (cyclophilin A)
MTKGIILAALVALVAAPALAHAGPAPAPSAITAPQEDLVRVALDTEKGRIVIALDRGRAPLTTANFLAYVDKHWLDGQPFYRALSFSAGGGIVQGGVRDGSKQLPPIEVETTAVTGLRNTAGAVVMANAGPRTTRSDFFILTADVPSFDATPTGPGFAPFGRVVDGMDVVKAILASPRSPTKGEGVMKGQMLEPEVKILKAARVK